MKDKFPTLDLHGVRHESAPRIIEDFILEKIDDLPIAVITGHSLLSRTIVLVSKEVGTKHPPSTVEKPRLLDNNGE